MGDLSDLTLTAIRPESVEIPAIRAALACPKIKPREAALGVAPIVVGTDPDCDLVARDARISRRHCELKLTDRGVVVRDLGSKNGVFIGETQVIQALVRPGQAITLGDSSLTLRAEGKTAVVPIHAGVSFGEAVGASVVMRELFGRMERVAPTDETVLLAGESGTGKELLARALHARSHRVAGPFAVFDCSAVAPTLVEAELFGHARGAFTGAVNARRGLLEEAHGGTLFLDEIGELPLDLQPKLLRALESRQYRPVGSSEWRSFDARVVAATHRDLRARVAQGTFREDLYYRLGVVELVVPALRDRKDDIPILVERFLVQQTPRRTLADLPPRALEMLAAHQWPGNVRELRNTVARLLLFPTEPENAIRAAPRSSAPLVSVSHVLGLGLREARDAVVEEFEKAYLAAKLEAHGGHIPRTAEAIGVSRQFLHRLADRYGLTGRG